MNTYYLFPSTYLAMQKMSPISNIQIALRIRAAMIHVNWTLRETLEGERVFWPQVIQKAGTVDVTELDEPLDIRNELFHMFKTDRTEEAALDFLRRVGAWQVVNDGLRESWAEGTYVSFNYRHRQVLGSRVLPVTLAELLRQTARWYKLIGIRSPKKLKAEFKEPHASTARQSDHIMYAIEAHLRNTLPISLEWHGKDPYAVIETVSACELMIAAAWADVVGHAEEQVCAECQTRFTWPRKKKHCRWECGHSAAVRKYKRKKALEKRKEKAGKSLR